MTTIIRRILPSIVRETEYDQCPIGDGAMVSVEALTTLNISYLDNNPALSITMNVLPEAQTGITAAP